MAAIVDQTIPSSSTFNALTREYLYGFLADNVFLDTPTLAKFKSRINYIDGRNEQPLVEYARASQGGWYGHGAVIADADLQALAAQIATRLSFTLARYRQLCVLDSWDTDVQGARAVVKLFTEYMRNIVSSAAEDISEAIFTGDPDDTDDIMTGLDIALDDTESWGNILPTDSGYEFWRPHFMEGTSTYAVAVPPSLANHRLLIRRMQATNKRKPDMIVTSELIWDVLAAQLDLNDVLTGQDARKNEVVRWGYDAIFINGVPVVYDLNVPGEAWVTGQSTRATAKGYQSMALDFSSIWLSANRKRSFAWDPRGWGRPFNMDAQANIFYAWLQLAGNNRRKQGRIWNMDADLTLAQMAAIGIGTVTRPVAA